MHFVAAWAQTEELSVDDDNFDVDVEVDVDKDDYLIMKSWQ